MQPAIILADHGRERNDGEKILSYTMNGAKVGAVITGGVAAGIYSVIIGGLAVQTGRAEGLGGLVGLAIFPITLAALVGAAVGGVIGFASGAIVVGAEYAKSYFPLAPIPVIEAAIE